MFRVHPLFGLVDGEPVEVTDGVEEAAAVHDELECVCSLREPDVGDVKRLPGLPAVGLRDRDGRGDALAIDLRGGRLHRLRRRHRARAGCRFRRWRC